MSSSIYKFKKPPIFNQEIFYDCGQSLLLALLDYDMINPITRLIRKKGDTIEDTII